MHVYEAVFRQRVQACISDSVNDTYTIIYCVLNKCTRKYAVYRSILPQIILIAIYLSLKLNTLSINEVIAHFI